MSRSPLVRQLARLRWRERCLALAWGVARVFAVAFFGLFVAFAVDSWIDRRHDTPLWVRQTLAAGQVCALIVAFFAWLVRPVFRRRRDDALALIVESRRPELEHRLITAVQLGRRRLNSDNISPELLAAVTREAEQACELFDIA